jgi:ureidoacrylate peracid hydrolase
MDQLHNRREAGAILLGVSGSIAVGAVGDSASATPKTAASRRIEITAKPDKLIVDLASTAVLVIDMQNDFGAKGGMFDHAGIDIGEIGAVVPQIQATLAVARGAGMQVVYVNMAYLADMSDAGRLDGPNRIKQAPLGIGKSMITPNGSRGAYMVRNGWNTKVVAELTPVLGDLVVHKTRYSGFANTKLHAVLQARRISNLIVTGCTTSVCVESTVRDAMFLDYNCVLLEDCMAEPQGATNHEASLQILSRLFAWVSDSGKFAQAVASG